MEDYRTRWLLEDVELFRNDGRTTRNHQVLRLMRSDGRSSSDRQLEIFYMIYSRFFAW